MLAGLPHDAGLHSDEFLNPVALDGGEAQRHTQTRHVPPTVSHREFDLHQISHFPSRSWCDHCVRGKAREDAHPSRHDPGKDARVGRDRFFLGRGTGDAHGHKPMFDVLDALSGAVFSAMVTRSEDEYAVAAEALRFTGRARVISSSDQKKPIKKLAELVRDRRKHDTVLQRQRRGHRASKPRCCKAMSHAEVADRGSVRNPA